jgi:hypothetical protein
VNKPNQPAIQPEQQQRATTTIERISVLCLPILVDCRMLCVIVVVRQKSHGRAVVNVGSISLASWRLDPVESKAGQV